MKLLELTNYDDSVKVTLIADNIILIYPTYKERTKYDESIVELGTTIECSHRRMVYAKEMYVEVLDKLSKLV